MRAALYSCRSLRLSSANLLTGYNQVTFFQIKMSDPLCSTEEAIGKVVRQGREPTVSGAQMGPAVQNNFVDDKRV